MGQFNIVFILDELFEKYRVTLGSFFFILLKRYIGEKSHAALGILYYTLYACIKRFPVTYGILFHTTFIHDHNCENVPCTS